MVQQHTTRRAVLRAGGMMAAVFALAACGQAAGSANAALSSAATSNAATATTGQVSTDTSSATTVAATATTDTTAATSSSAASTSPALPATSTAAAISSMAAPSASTTATAAASTSAASAASSARGVTLTIVPAGTVGSYHVQEQLAGHNFPSQAVGKTSAVTGAIVLDPNGKIVPAQSKIELDLRTLQSDQRMRDQYIQQDPLETSQYPYATFVPSQASGLPWPLPASGTAAFKLGGNMTVHGTTKALTWDVSATFAADKVTGTASSPFTFTEFGMQPPHTMIALSVQDGGTWQLQFTATRA